MCQDQIDNGQPYPPGPPWYMRIFGKCHPTDCDWGQVGAQRLSTGHIYATYDQGFAREDMCMPRCPSIGLGNFGSTLGPILWIQIGLIMQRKTGSFDNSRAN